MSVPVMKQMRFEVCDARRERGGQVHRTRHLLRFKLYRRNITVGHQCIYLRDSLVVHCMMRIFSTLITPILALDVLFLFARAAI
jgi:hypothetical protein